MRKLFFMLLVLLLGVTLSHTAQAADYLVCGAGKAAANGTYVESGSFGGRPVYVNGTYRLFFRTCFNRWIIINGSNLADSDCPRYRNDSTGSLPPETGWTTHNGPAPAPTVCLAQPTVTYSRDLFTALSADDGSIDNTTPLIITHNNYDGDAFDGSVGEDFCAGVDPKLSVSNLPTGLTVVATYVNNLTLSVTITGNATAHTIGDDISDLTFAFQDSAFTLSTASEVYRSYKDDLRIYFYREYMALYAGTEVANGIYGLDGFHNGKMKFTKPGHVMCWYDNNGGSYPRWFIGPNTTYSSRYYESNNYTSSDTPPLGTAWRKYGSSLSPGPDVRIASPAVIYSKTTFGEVAEDDGSIDNGEPLIITHNNYDGDEFGGTDGEDFCAGATPKLLVTNLPAGLTAVATRTSATELSVTISGNATSHADANDVNNLTFAFQNTAFFGDDASIVYGSTRNNLRVNFDTVTYVVSGGSAAVNGLYKDDGTYASRPKYVKGSYTMGFRPCRNRWIIIHGVNLKESDCPIYSNPSTGSLPPETNWSLPSLLVQKAEPILSYSNNIFAESSADDGSINNTSPLIITHNNSAGDAFDGSVGEDFVASGKLVVPNPPDGLMVVATYVNNLTLSVTITGNATAHTIGDDISDLTFAFQDSAFTLSNAPQVFRSYKDDLRINFYRDYMVIDAGTTGANGIYGLDGGFNGKMTFTKAGDVLYWGTSGATSNWRIGPDTNYHNAYYYHNTSTADTPPQNDWRSYSTGLRPGPTVLPAQPALHYSKTFFAENAADDGTIDNTTPLIITHNNYDGDEFTGSNGDDFVGDGKLVVTNRPGGLTVVATRNSNTEISVTLTGTAGSHANADDVNNLTFSFQNGAFSGNDASLVYRSTRNDLEVNFDLERYLVSGSASAGVDGIYSEYGGSFNGHPRYVKGTYRMGYRGCTSSNPSNWVIVNNGDSGLYKGGCPRHRNGSNTSLPPETGWLLGTTAPTVTLVTAPSVSFTAASQTGAENVGTMTITAQLSFVSTDAATVPFTLSGTASEGGTEDYTITASPITIPNGDLTQDITITINDDALDENNETVIVTMGTPTNATQGTTTVHTATITDNDDSPAVSSIVRADANPTNAASVDFTVTFSKSVTGVDTDDFSLTTSGSASGTISNVAGSGTARTVSVNSITGDGTLRLDVTDNDTITDGVNLLGPGDGSFNTGESYAIDNDTPEISSFERLTPATTPTNADTLVFRATFDEDVQNVDAADFNVTGTTATIPGVAVTAANTAFDITVSGGDLAGLNGTVGLDLAGGQNITDLVGNALPAGEPGTDETYTVENDPPGLTSFTRQTPATSPTNADTLVFQAIFDEDVQNVNAGDFVVNGTTSATVTNVNPVDASTYNVTVSGGDLAGFDGDVGLDLAVGQDITDLAGSALPAGEPATDQTYTVDNDAPGVTSFVYQTPATSPTNADTLVFRVTFDKDVQNMDATDFAVTGTTATVTGVVVVTANTVYDVTVSGGDLAGLNGTIGLDLDGGQNITDLVGNALPPGEPGTDETYELDNAAPTVTINHGGDDPTDTSPVDFTAVFNEPINAITFTDADVTIGGTATTGAVTVAEEAPPNDGTTFSVSIEVTTNGTVTAGIPAGVVEDLAGNTNEASTSTDNSVTYEGLPDVTTDSVTGETSHSATVNGTITDCGVSNPTAHGVVWDLVAEGSDPTLADNSTDKGAVAGPAPFAFTTTMTGLDPNTDYAMRAYATNTAGTAYGNVLTFTTLPSALPPVYYLLDEPEPKPGRR